MDSICAQTGSSPAGGEQSSAPAIAMIGQTEQRLKRNEKFGLQESLVHRETNHDFVVIWKIYYIDTAKALPGTCFISSILQNREGDMPLCTTEYHLS